MLIAIDIGNTNITVGVLKDLEVLQSFKVPTELLKSKPRALKALKDKLSKSEVRVENIRAVYATSVVPALNKNIRVVFNSLFKKETVIVGEDVIVPVINRYRIPSQVGQDRLVNAYACLKLYGPGLVIIDFGTAITFDVVSKNAEYLGGLIVPGLKLMQESLHKRTALLPYVELSKPIEIIGQDTVSSIRAGIVYGTAGVCDGIIQRLMAKECRGYKVIVTGGDADLIQPYVTQKATFEEFLILKGLALIFKSQQNSK